MNHFVSSYLSWHELMQPHDCVAVSLIVAILAQHQRALRRVNRCKTDELAAAKFTQLPPQQERGKTKFVSSSSSLVSSHQLAFQLTATV
jgi:hypothetical protein